MFKQFREKIAETMKAKGLKRADLARITGTDYSYLNRLLKGEARFNEDHIETISKALDIMPWGEPAPIPVRITYSRKFKDPDLPRKRESDYLPVELV